MADANDQTTERIGDRRKRPTPFISKYTLSGRRRQARRTKEQHNYYVDRLGSKVWALIALVVILSVTDSVFTLYFLQKGYREINPLMNVSLIIGKPVFIIVKYLCTISGILILGLHKNFIFVKTIITFIIVSYLLLNGYHLWLFMN